jgi:hypothetical protein
MEFVQTEEKRTQYFRKDAYSFRKDRPYHRLQRLCFWILQKIGAFDVGENLTYTRHTIDTQSFMERLFRQQSHLEGYFNRRPKRLLIGAEDFAVMMGSEEIRQQLIFRTEYGHGREIMGLQVEVIPWMRGILVMP